MRTDESAMGIGETRTDSTGSLLRAEAQPTYSKAAVAPSVLRAAVGPSRPIPPGPIAEPDREGRRRYECWPYLHHTPDCEDQKAPGAGTRGSPEAVLPGS